MPDVVIVGGGTSGSVLAARLSEDPARHVVLLEAGPDDSTYDERVRDPRRALELFNGGGVAEPFTMDGGQPITMVRGRGLGGTSAVNFLAAARGKPADYGGWDLPGWTWADLEPLFERAEVQLGVRPGDGLSRVAEAFLAGVPGAQVLSAARHPNGDRRTVSEAYLTPEVRARPNLTVHTDTPVDRLVDGGVRTTTGETVVAGEVIVSCGATRTPTLLQRSGIDCGHGLQDHLGIGTLYQHDGPSSLGGSPAQVLWDGGDVHLIPTVVADEGATTTVAVLAFLLDLDDRGWVRDGEVRTQRFDERDAARLRLAVERLAVWEASDAFRALGLHRLVELPDPATSSVISYGHQAGTCAMGDVLDETCRVVGVDGLRVVDASSLPRLPAAPPYLTCVVLAERIAELL
ncbi:MAG: 5-(hydroxymethyl)furfural oxidase [Actinomycetia bacterium]|nr:5-(hydroxymethyl)furfural oxidase [Actinomycetes bacterium]